MNFIDNNDLDSMEGCYNYLGEFLNKNGADSTKWGCLTKLYSNLNLQIKSNAKLLTKMCKQSQKFEKALELIEELTVWKDVNKELPSIKNGYIDDLVLIAVKNKNKEDGIYLYDVCFFDDNSRRC